MDVTGYSPREEWANRLSHGLGLLLGGLGLVLLLYKGWDQGPRVLLSYGVYGASLVLLYLASTLYHSVSSVAARRWSKLFDHCAIYLLIAGTYTPFLLVALDTPLAQGLMVVIWGLALAGVVFKLIFINRFKKVSLFTYLMLGWLSLVVIYQLYLHLDGTGLQGESVNILLKFTQFVEASIEYLFQVFTAHSCNLLLPSDARFA